MKNNYITDNLGVVELTPAEIAHINGGGFWKDAGSFAADCFIDLRDWANSPKGQAYFEAYNNANIYRLR